MVGHESINEDCNVEHVTYQDARKTTAACAELGVAGFDPVCCAKWASFGDAMTFFARGGPEKSPEIWWGRKYVARGKCLCNTCTSEIAGLDEYLCTHSIFRQ